ncbi:hypothetical protein F5Y17DRAFT_452464 [Xylariaceae sp. FL0594]|nr:hypothetical protein F5Y17DRAFT_452464 [Xylariaceae sp. FL0594]
MPAASYGVWGVRSTWNSWPLQDIMPGVPAFDTLGALARSPKYLRTLLLGRKSAMRDIEPCSLIIPTDWFPMANKQQQRMIDAFVDIMESYLKVPVVRLSLEAEWTRSGPVGHRSKSLKEFLDKSIYWPNYYDGYHSYDAFRQDF